MADYSNRKALIVGAARSGLSAARLLDSLGSETAITDMKPANEIADLDAHLLRRTKRMLGGHDGIDLSGYDLVVLSPGVPWDSPLPARAREARIEIVSELELAFASLKAPVIAITGTNGKSTTTAMIGGIARAGGARVYVGGNIGAPLADAVGSDYDWVVAEVSSFQLEAIKTFRPKIGLLLNITPDHIDRHGSMEVYSGLKARLFENQRADDIMIINADDPQVMDASLNTIPMILRFSRLSSVVSGAWIEEGIMSVRIGSGEITRLFAIDKLKVKGSHNIENAMAASIAGIAAGIDAQDVTRAILDFKGLPHRMELVREINGVRFYNDSKGTNIDASVKSLAGFSKNVVLIAGGSSKGLDFAPLVKAIFKHAKGVALIGETAREIEKSLGQFQPRVIAKDMGQAVRIATQWCGPGDAVLLSPGCASFDMYENFEQRGESFISAVNNISESLQTCR